MTRYTIPKNFRLDNLPEFTRFQAANPGKKLDSRQAIVMFGRAVHWLAIFEIIWPDFGNLDYYSIEVKYIVHNDPDRQLYSNDFYKQIAETIAMFWNIQLEYLYPKGNWIVAVHNDPEITVDATIHKEISNHRAV